MLAPNSAPRTAHESISRRTACIVLCALVVLAAYLRFRGYDALLPYGTQPDARPVVQQIELIRTGAPHPERDPNWSYYSLFVARVVAMLPEAKPSAARSLEEHLTCAGLMFAQMRLLSILISLLAVPATYLLARWFLDRTRSIFAAGLIATSLLHGSLSTLEKPHAIVTSFVLLGMLAALRTWRKPTIGSYALCGISGAAALGALQNGLMVLPAFAAAHLLGKRGNRTRTIAWIGPCVAVAILAVGWYWLWPGRPSREGHEPGKWSITMTGQVIDLSKLDGKGAVRMVSELWGLDPLLVLLCAIGLGCGAAFGLARIWKSGAWRPLAIVLASVAPYAALTGLYSYTAGRYVLPLVPYIACVAASAIPRRFAGVSLLLLIVPLVPAWRMAELRARPDTYEEAATFIAQHVPPEETVLEVPPFDVPLFTDERTTRANAALPWATSWSRYLAGLDPSWIEGTRHSILNQPSSGTSTPRRHASSDLSYFEANGARWVLSGCGKNPPSHGEELATLRTQAQLVARFSPLADDDGRDTTMPPFDPDRWPGLFPRAWRIVQARAIGPTLELFRLP